MNESQGERSRGSRRPSGTGRATICTVALMSAGGVYVEGEDPTGGETQEQAVARIGEYLRESPTLVSIHGLGIAAGAYILYSPSRKQSTSV